MLKKYGWSLWWDGQIPAGESFDRVSQYSGALDASTDAIEKFSLISFEPEMIEVVGQSNSLIFSLTFPSDKTAIPIIENNSVTELEFARQDPSGEGRLHPLWSYR